MLPNNLHSQWHPVLNRNLTIEDVSKGSTQKVWWVCEKGHEWEAPVYSRIKGAGCPYCSGRKPIVGVNDLATLCPKIATEWHPTLNGAKQPHEFKAKSDAKIWWLGSCGHEWETTINNRVSGKKCVYCSGNRTLPGFNDLATLYPTIASEWHPTKNLPSTPDNVTKTSGKVFWWVCDKGHEWEAPIYRRTLNKSTCVYCAGRKVSTTNSLITTHNFLVKEWDAERNHPERFENYSKGSKTKAWWVCDRGHSWQATIKDRTRGTGCPHCVGRVSKPEQDISDFLVKLGLHVISNTKKVIPPFELDIWVPDQKMAIEFNGVYWHDENHKPRNYHYDKWLACKNQGIQLIQIWEDDWSRNPDLIKRMLAHKMGVTNQERIYGRKCSVEEIPYNEAKDFFIKNHIQGAVKATKYFGLKTDDLVAVLAVKHSSVTNVLQVERFATDQPVVGGFSKLLNHAEKIYSPTEVVTFSDNCVSDGGLYERTGFKIVKHLSPDYMYVVGGERKHKFGYRLKKFKNNPNLQYVEGLTEKELAKLNNIPRIWDAGKTKWVKSK